MPHSLRLPCFLISLLVAASNTAIAADIDRAELEQQYSNSIQALVNDHCVTCHGGTEPEGNLDLSKYDSVEHVVEDFQTWQIVKSRLEQGDMPPADADPQLPDANRNQIIGWLKSLRRSEAARNAGDPGTVLARRLSNAEFNYSIRDLTGIDIRPTRDFPVDPANEAGFDNSGESLAMTPALLRKYLEAAREVADHLVLKPSGIDFAPHPAVTDTDRDKYCVNRIINFYRQQNTDYADYFMAAWKHRCLGDQPTLDQLAAEHGLSAPYLKTLWLLLEGKPADFGPIAELQRQWKQLPNDIDQADTARTGCVGMRYYVTQLRAKLKPHFDNLHTDGVHAGSQAFVLWKNRQYAAMRRKCDPRRLADLLASTADTPSATQEQTGDLTLAAPVDESQQTAFKAEFDRFCAVFPDAFYIAERGRDYTGDNNPDEAKGRYLSAGFHSMMGYFRDDGPLYELMLDSDQQQQLDTLWQELDYITSAPMRQYSGFLWFERTDSDFTRDREFDFARPADKDSASPQKISRFADLYLAKAIRNGGKGDAVQAIKDYFTNINAEIRSVEQQRHESEPVHLDAVIQFAAKAFRRSLSDSEQDDLRSFYHALRTQDELSHEDSIKDLLVSILVSPQFCYRTDMAAISSDVHDLTDLELASRLSFFLWSSVPDSELLELAQQSQLRQPQVLTSQITRMLKDQRSQALAVEFAGNWLDFRRFEEHNSVDRIQFPQFTNELRQAMFEEPVRYFADVIRSDRSVLDLVYGNDTFVNSELANHYGFSDLKLKPGEWQHVANAGDHHRGGLLPMSLFLTKNAPGRRTSPVKRGYWVVRRLLGEHIPPPPPNVPELPDDESKLGDLTLREALAAHRQHASCAVCHEKFDSMGLVFENFGPVGELRNNDLAGRPVDVQADFPDGTNRSGVKGLQQYIRDTRQQDFIDNFCRKLLTYALGRSLQPSDDLLIEQMAANLSENDHRFSSMVDTIVNSPQFLKKRGHTAAQPQKQIIGAQ